MPVIIHGFELNMFGFLLKDLIGARLSSNMLTAFRKYSLEHLGQGYNKVFANWLCQNQTRIFRYQSSYNIF